MSEPVQPQQIDIHTTAGKLADLQRRIEEATHAGSERAVEKQHAKGKLTARERIELLLDEDSFVELDEFATHRSTNFGLENNRPYGDGVVTGYGTVDGRPVAVFSQDFTVFGGSLGEVYGAEDRQGHGLRAEDRLSGHRHQRRRRRPHPGGRRRPGRCTARSSAATSTPPASSRRSRLIVGPCAGGAVYSPAITDFTVMVDQTSHMFITGPDVIKTVTGEDVGFEELGGARTHNSTSGVAHHMAGDEKDAIEYVKSAAVVPAVQQPQRAPAFPEEADLAVTDEDRELDVLIPDSANQPYDMHTVIEHVLDDAEFLETQSLFAPNILTGFGRVEGHPVGIVANQPMQFAGCLDIDASARRRPASSVPATPSTSRSSPSSTFPASCRASTRSTTASSAAAPS